MLLFGMITYYNIRKSHRRLIQPKEQQRSRTDSQLITIILLFRKIFKDRLVPFSISE